MSSSVVKDITRAIARADDSTYTDRELVDLIGENLAYALSGAVNLPRIAKRDVDMILASHGAGPRAAGLSRAIATRIRSDFKNHSWTAALGNGRAAR